MKRLIVCCVVVFVIIATSILFLGCPGKEDECPAPTGSEHFYVSFVLDGPAIDGSVTITTFGNVEGDVIGTFDLTFEAVEHSAPSYGIDLTAKGQFCVKCVADSIRFGPV